jgi:hypothetical protein
MAVMGTGAWAATVDYGEDDGVTVGMQSQRGSAGPGERLS